ncbi:alpha/beta fold hydrolase [Actinophytocola oryzae]|uniref:Pimeloyl-ACP methyl ester carboxylesterase n=1 Tax=Actinophytocola oryzae TaxID=502181 RepID=A0A4R7W6S5_9PSEU|nr:alpha/beta hydrolase [Actinophytocola oryzae]TDV57397.1 pimeloyl-ACP methyl ester carboxylesterase [Actinophytocola oryzae]
MDILLIAGLWLDGSAWDEVLPGLVERGHRPVPVTLPQHGAATLDDQLTAVLAALAETTGPALVVGHSAACTLAWLAADARPDEVAGVAFVGGFPVADGRVYFDLIEPVGGIVDFPGWEPFAGPDSADLDDAARERFATAAIPVPEGVATAVVGLTDARRYDIPVTVVCPEFGPDDARGWIAAGQVPELAKVSTLAYADIDSGHWPMITRPAELAELLADATRVSGKHP